MVKKEKECELCKKRAHWKRIRDKKGAIMLLCDECLTKQPNAVELLDDYKYIGK